MPLLERPLHCLTKFTEVRAPSGCVDGGVDGGVNGGVNGGLDRMHLPRMRPSAVRPLHRGARGCEV